MDNVLDLLIKVTLIVCALVALPWACDRFKVPDPVRWIIGIIVLVILLAFLLQLTGFHSFGHIKV